MTRTETTTTKTERRHHFLRTLALVVAVAAALAMAFVGDVQAKKRPPAPVPAQEGPIIAFTSSRDGNEEIYKMNEDGSNQTNLTNNAASDTQAAVSPDGTKIAFVRRDNEATDTKEEIYMMDADTGDNQENVTKNPAYDGQPSFQPDGSTIAFTTDRDGNNEIYIVDTHGTYMSFNYTRNPAESDFGANWSTDGSNEFLAFTRSVYNQENGTYNYEVYEMGLAGQNQTNLTKNAAAHDLHPSYSGDGTKIAFTTNPNLNQDIYKMNRDGSSAVQLTTNSASDSDPDWTKKAPSQ